MEIPKLKKSKMLTFENTNIQQLKNLIKNKPLFSPMSANIFRRHLLFFE